ncbi:MAG TPA: hypothetical protein VFW05_09110 [Verrucomicrobiae bacterium]|nr:hypothetical protein [Verrucomicrobiae bacterium]
MKKFQGFVVGILLLAASQTTLPAQTQTLLTAEEAPVEMVLLQSEEIPVCGTFYLLSDLAQTPAGAPPYPCVPPKAASAPVYQIEDNLFVVDDLAANQSVFEAASVNSITEELEEQIQTLVQSVRTARANRAMSLAMFGTEFETQSTMSFAETYSTDDLWLELVSKTNELANFMIHPPTAEEGTGVYDLFMTTSLTAEGSGLNGTNWLWLLRTSPGQTNVAYSPLLDEICFFRLARTNDADADGLSDALEHLSSHTDANNADENANGIPDGWEWSNFGDLNQTAGGDYDGDGSDNQYEFQNNRNPNSIVFWLTPTNQYSSSALVFLEIAVSNGVPAEIAVLMDDTNTAAAKWASWSGVSNSNLFLNLGSVEGWHSVRVGLRGRAAFPPVWQQVDFKLDTMPPALAITNPIPGNTISKRMTRLLGAAPEPLASLHWSVVNANGIVTNQIASVAHQGFETNTFEFTSSSFQGYDVALADGVNSISIQATDLAGNVTTTNFNVLVDVLSNTNPPVLNVIWPTNGAYVSGTNFTLRGRVDDATAQVTGLIVNASNQISAAGVVDRDGLFWVKNLPLADGTNAVTLTATNAAGLSSSTVLTIFKSAVDFRIIDVGLLEGPMTTVSGYVSDPSYTVSVNGQTAVVNPNGSWAAAHVRVYGRGTASFSATASDSGSGSGGSSGGSGSGSGSGGSGGSGSSSATTSFTANINPAVRLVEYHGKVNQKSVLKNLAAQPTIDGSETFDYSEHWKQDGQGQWYRDFEGHRLYTSVTSGSPGIIRNTADYTWSSADPVGTVYTEYDYLGDISSNTAAMEEGSEEKFAPIHDAANVLVRHSIARGVSYNWDVFQGAFEWGLGIKVSAQSRQEYIVPGESLPGLPVLAGFNSATDRYGRADEDAVADHLNVWEGAPRFDIHPDRIAGQPTDSNGEAFLVASGGQTIDASVTAKGNQYRNHTLWRQFGIEDQAKQRECHWQNAIGHCGRTHRAAMHDWRFRQWDGI